MTLDPLTIIREQVARVNSLFVEVMAHVTAEQLAWQPTPTTNPIAVTVLHVYHGEDRLIHRLRGDKPTLFEANGWQARLGYDPANRWAPLANLPDPAALRAYAAEVFAETQRFLEELTPEALEGEMTTPRGKSPLSTGLPFQLVIHKATHMGEVAALLGCQGVKGFPV